MRAPPTSTGSSTSLVANALRYSPAGSTVATRRGGARPSTCSTTGRASRRARRTTSSSASTAAARAAPGRAGSGLGLPIARELAAEWAAAVALANRPDGGAHASVRFRGGAVAPCAAAGAVPAAHEAPAAGPGRRRTRADARAAAVAVLATAGIALAAGVSVATGTLTSQRIGLAAEPISAGAGLAPPRAAAERATKGDPGGIPHAGRRAAVDESRSARRPAPRGRAARSRAGRPRRRGGPAAGAPRQGNDYGGSGEGSGEADD